MAATSKTHLKTRWIPSEFAGKVFLTCENCKDKNIKIRMAYKKSYSEMWEYCPKCGAKFTKTRKSKKGAQHVKKQVN